MCEQSLYPSGGAATAAQQPQKIKEGLNMCAAIGGFGVFHFQFPFPVALHALISFGDSFYDIRGQSEIDTYFILLKAYRCNILWTKSSPSSPWSASVESMENITAAAFGCMG